MLRPWKCCRWLEGWRNRRNRSPKEHQEILRGSSITFDSIPNGWKSKYTYSRIRAKGLLQIPLNFTMFGCSTLVWFFLPLQTFPYPICPRREISQRRLSLQQPISHSHHQEQSASQQWTQHHKRPYHWLPCLFNTLNCKPADLKSRWSWA